jgi:hypothetical protein
MIICSTPPSSSDSYSEMFDVERKGYFQLHIFASGRESILVAIHVLSEFDLADPTIDLCCCTYMIDMGQVKGNIIILKFVLTYIFLSCCVLQQIQDVYYLVLLAMH